MPEKDDKDAKDFHVGVPMRCEPFFLRGSNSLDWGLKNRLAKIFNPESGRTVMLAIDHGYFQGPTTGLERVDVNIVPLLRFSDTLMCTRGILRSTIPPTYGKGIVLRMSGGPSVLKELSNEQLACDIEDALRLNVAAMAVQVFIGGEARQVGGQHADADRRRGLPQNLQRRTRGHGRFHCRGDGRYADFFWLRSVR